MTKSQLSQGDIISLIQLLGEIIALNGAHFEAKRLLMDGLCRLVNADCWLWALGCDIKSGGTQSYGGLLHSASIAEERLANFLIAVEHPEMPPVVAPIFQRIEEEQRPVTMARHEMDPEGISEIGELGDAWRAADMGSLVMSCHPLPNHMLSSVGIYRRLNQPKFTSRDIQLIHMVLTEVRWLHAEGWGSDWDQDLVASLSARKRLVLNLALEGWSRKQIAVHIGLSVQTVSSYFKSVYREFGVHSQAELMSKFHTGSML